MGKRKEIEGKCTKLSNRAETQSPELGPRTRGGIGQSFLVLVLLVSGPLRSFHMEIQGEQSLVCTKGLNSFRLEDQTGNGEVVIQASQSVIVPSGALNKAYCEFSLP